MSQHTDGMFTRPQTPSPATPESERLADTVLRQHLCNHVVLEPEISSSALEALRHQAFHGPIDPAAAHIAQDVLGLRTLSALSQEGSLDGYADDSLHLLPHGLTHSTAAAAAAFLQQQAAAAAPAQGAGVTCSSSSSSSTGQRNSSNSKATLQQQSSSASLWDALMQELPVLASLKEALDKLPRWLANCWNWALQDVSSEVSDLQHLLNHTLNSTEQQAQQVGHMLSAKAQVLARTVVVNVPTPLLQVLGTTSAVALAGLAFYAARCQQLGSLLKQRDRELARLLLKALHLQAALANQHSSFALSHQSAMMSHLVPGV